MDVKRKRSVPLKAEAKKLHPACPVLGRGEISTLQKGFIYKLVNTAKCTNWALNNIEACWAARANI